LSFPALRRMPLTGRVVWIGMMTGIGVEFALGVASLLLVPVGRPNDWLPPQGVAVYLGHAILGGILALGALVIFVAGSHATRNVRMGAHIGLGGIVVGALGGMLAAFHPWRLTGMGLMLVGTFVAFFGYLIPLLDPISSDGPE
jgi:hypothetical protein